jgi:hypothetical protein
LEYEPKGIITKAVLPGELLNPHMGIIEARYKVGSSKCYIRESRLEFDRNWVEI